MAGNAGALARKANLTLNAGEGARVPRIQESDPLKIEAAAPPEHGCALKVMRTRL